MAIDVRNYKKKVLNQKPSINLVPFIDILFTIMIFLVVTSNFSADVQTDDSDVADDATGKPNVTDVSGDAQYYVMPVANLHKVTVNGVDRSDTIAGNAVGVLGKVIDQGQVVIKPGEIEITTPAGVSPDEAVQRPEL